MIKNINSYRESVMDKYQKGTDKGMDIGFKSLNELISIKAGYTTYIVGFAGAGKTELHLEILFNLTQKYGWKHAILSPEIGSVDDVIAELVSKYLKRPFYKSNPYAPQAKDIHSAMDWLSNYFYPLDNDTNDYDVDTLYEDVLKLEKDNKIHMDSVSIDPWNDLNENLIAHGGREDKYLTWALKRVRQDAKVNSRHNFIVTHARDLPPINLKSTKGGNVVCTAKPTLNSFAGGQVWSRRAFNVLGLWRPEEDAINPTTKIAFQKNEAVVLSLKSKPKGVGRKGVGSIFFDWKTNRYYEEIDGKTFYAFEHENIPPPAPEPEQTKFPYQAYEEYKMNSGFDKINTEDSSLPFNEQKPTDADDLPF